MPALLALMNLVAVASALKIDHQNGALDKAALVPPNKSDPFLEISRSYVTTVPQGALCSWPYKSLRIGPYNVFPNLGGRLFGNCPNLLELDVYLNHNSVAVEPDAFHTMPRVTKIWLWKVKMETISKEHFRLTPNLDDLHIHASNLTTIEAGAFDRAPNLRKLDLQHNLLASVDGTFLTQKLGFLTYLSLADNRLTSFPWEVLDNLVSLRNLRLTDNKISSLDLGKLLYSSVDYLQADENPVDYDYSVFEDYRSRRICRVADLRILLDRGRPVKNNEKPFRIVKIENCPGQ